MEANLSVQSFLSPKIKIKNLKTSKQHLNKNKKQKKKKKKERKFYFLINPQDLGAALKSQVMGLHHFLSQPRGRNYHSWHFSKLQENDGAEFLSQAAKRNVGHVAKLMKVANDGYVRKIIYVGYICY